VPRKIAMTSTSALDSTPTGTAAGSLRGEAREKEGGREGRVGNQRGVVSKYYSNRYAAC